MKVNTKNTRIDFPLNNVDPEDINDVLKKIQASFDIRFAGEDLKEVITFGDLCDTVLKKVKHKNADSCTTQQAFYKLRNAITLANATERELLKPQTRLAEIFPRDTRMELIGAIEAEMGIHLDLLKPKGWIVFVSGAFFIISFIITFLYPAIGGAGMVVAATGLVLAGKFGKEMYEKTLGDLAEKIAREHYFQCRRNASTVNRNEIAQKVKELFSSELIFSPQMVKRGRSY